MATQHLHATAFRGQRRAWPGLQRAHAPVDLLCPHLPLQRTILPREPRRKRGLGVILVRGLHLVEARDGLHQQLRAGLGEPLGQDGCVLAGANQDRARREHRSVVELLIHLHDRDAGLAVPRQDRVRHRRRAAPARQQRGMHVQHTAARDLEDRGRDDLAVRDDHHQVRCHRAEALPNRGIADALRLIHVKAELHGGDLHRRRCHLHAVAGPVRLRDDERDRMTGGVKGAQRRHGEGSGAGENQLQESS